MAPLGIAADTEGSIRVPAAVCRSYLFDGLEPEVARVTDAALAKLKAAGVTLVETEIPELGNLVAKVTEQIQFHDTEPSLTRYRAAYRTGVPPPLCSGSRHRRERVSLAELLTRPRQTALLSPR